MREPQVGFVQYRGLTIADLLTHINYSRSKSDPTYLFELLLGPTGIEISLRQQEYKTKPAELQLILRSGSIGRTALDAICEILKAKPFRLGIRLSPKLRLITRAVVAIPIDDPELENRFSELLKVVANETGFSWPTEIAAEHMIHTISSSNLPGELSHNTEMFELGRKAGRVVGVLTRYLAVALLAAAVIYVLSRT